jgi:hypothetical protein
MNTMKRDISSTTKENSVLTPNDSEKLHDDRSGRERTKIKKVWH